MAEKKIIVDKFMSFERANMDKTDIPMGLSHRPLSLGGHVESQKNKKLCFRTASLAQTRIQCEACRAKPKVFILLRLNMAAE